MDLRDQNSSHLETHFYYTGKRKLIESLLKKANLPANAKILDVGCGTGSDLEVIKSFGEVTVLDIDQTALNKIPDNYKKIKMDLAEINLQIKKFDCIVAFDVLEHIKNEESGIKNLFKYLKKDGIFIGTVPAYQFLYSQHDKLLCHFRRYTRKNFIQKLEKKGFNKKYSGYWMSLLFPIAGLLRILKKQTNEQKTDIRKIAKPINFIFSQILKFEALFGTSRFFRFPFGLTVWIICKK